jgi:hypothetical protein
MVRAPNPHLAGGWIGQELDFSDPLLQLIEHRDAAFDQRISVDRWPDPCGLRSETEACFTRNCAVALAMLPACTTSKKCMEVAHSNGAHSAWRWYARRA